MKVQFLGAAQNVTGSKYLFEIGAARILVDCGLFQEREFRGRNWDHFPVPPKSIDCVVLSHAHVDHCGYLPKLVKEGFRGPIVCTHPTAEIAGIVLQDTAHLQEADARQKKRRHKREGRRGPHPEVPLYTVRDAQRVLSQFKTIGYGQPLLLGKDIQVAFFDAGHILGAAMVELKVKTKSGECTVVFSGDIGRWNRPILNDPTLFSKADVVLMESTYGDRVVEEADGSKEKLREMILAAQEAGGNVIIPTFAIERAQELIYDFAELFDEGKIPPVPVFVDSPMAARVTAVFKKHWAYMDRDAQALKARAERFLKFPLLRFVRSEEESRALPLQKGTSVIMAGSGMCTGGRVKRHLSNHISQPENMILFVGYQARGTLGRTILERPKEVRIFGEYYPVRARIEKINGFSAHADQTELLKWISAFEPPPRKIFIMHGEPAAQQALAQKIKSQMPSQLFIPQYLDVNELN